MAARLESAALRTSPEDALAAFAAVYQPLASIAGTILNTATLADEGIPATLQSMLLPALLMTYGSSIVANAVYPRFSFSREGVVTFALGFVLSLYVHDSRALLFFIRGLPNISRIISALKLVRSEERSEEVFPWIVVNSVAGLVIKRLILGRQMQIRRREIFNIVASNYGLYIIKREQLPPGAVVLLIAALFVADKLQARLWGDVREEVARVAVKAADAATDEDSGTAPTRRRRTAARAKASAASSDEVADRPRRRAAVAAAASTRRLKP